jgi:Protein of unknown function (DUF1579)
MFTRSRLTVLLLLFVTAATPAAGPPSKLKDPFLDNLVGNWHVERKFGSGRTAENTVHAEWVLDHQFLELHYLDVATPLTYEAMVFIGYNAGDQIYVCHWIDNFGGEFSALGSGKIDSERHAIEFTFNYKNGPFTNKFSFDPATKTWTSLMRQKEKGDWKVFAEDTFTPVEQRK